ncbi:hypothetical protein [Burkholderia glumae]|uniref:hypothetical protein n=1 Tax=Burkholderia glumae TaxID=337 RepID=UPI00215169FC|nr:hypothetical protein [Burkholderia glumae]
MATKTEEHEYRIRQLERQVSGLQREIEVIHSFTNSDRKTTDQRIRDLEIKAAVSRGAPQKEVAKIFKLSPGRVSQIVKKIA